MADLNNFMNGYKRVLCICSDGINRSPTAALVLSIDPFNFNTRAVGLVKQFSLIGADSLLFDWADEIVCMEPSQEESIRALTPKPILCLNIENCFSYRAPRLVELVAEKYRAATLRGHSAPKLRLSVAPRMLL